MTFKQWNKFLFFVAVISAITFLLYQTTACYARDVSGYSLQEFKLIFVTANAADITPEESAKSFILSMGDEVISAIGDTSLVNPHFRVHVKSESVLRPAVWIKALERKRKSLYPCGPAVRVVNIPESCAA